MVPMSSPDMSTDKGVSWKLVASVFVAAMTLIPLAVSQNCDGSVRLGGQSFVAYQTIGESLVLQLDEQRTDLLLSLDRQAFVHWYRNGIVNGSSSISPEWKPFPSVQARDNGTRFFYEIWEVLPSPSLPVVLNYTSEIVILLVGTPPNITSLLPRNTFEYNDGSEATGIIPFAVSGIPTASLTVFRSNMTKANAMKFIAVGDTVRVKGLTLTDRGTYIIKASNCFGNSTVGIQIDILGGIRLKGLSSDRSDSAFCGNATTFECVAVGFPKPTVTWIWNKDQQLIPDEGRFVIEQTDAKAEDGYKDKITSTLGIRNLQRVDNLKGGIRCLAENGIGNESAEFSLHVKCTPTPCRLDVLQTLNSSIAVNLLASNDPGGEPISSYQLLAYEVDQNHSESLMFNETRLQIAVINVTMLPSRSSIRLECSARNKFGYGIANKIIAQTLGEPRSVRIDVGEVDCTAATLRFVFDQGTDSDIVHYEIRYTELLHSFVGSSAPSLEKTEDHTCPVVTLLNLERNANYSAKVKAFNQYGSGDYSIPAYFKTVCQEEPPEVIKIVVPTVSVVLVIGTIIGTIIGFSLKNPVSIATKRLINTTFRDPVRKVLIIGLAGHGKSSLINTFNYIVNRQADHNFKSSILGNVQEGEDASHTEKFLLYDGMYCSLEKSRLWKKKAEKCPLFLDSRGLRNDEDQHVLIKMLAKGVLHIGTNLAEICTILNDADDLEEAGELIIRQVNLNDGKKRELPTVAVIIIKANVVLTEDFPRELLFAVAKVRDLPPLYCIITFADELVSSSLGDATGQNVTAPQTSEGNNSQPQRTANQSIQDINRDKIRVKEKIKRCLQIPTENIFFVTNWRHGHEREFKEKDQLDFIEAFQTILS